MTYDTHLTTPPKAEEFIEDLIFALRPRVYKAVEFLPDSTKDRIHMILYGEELFFEPHYDEDGDVDPIRTACLIDDLVHERSELRLTNS